MCDSISIKGEYHYFIECTYMSNERKNIITYSRFCKIHIKFMSNEKIQNYCQNLFRNISEISVLPECFMTLFLSCILYFICKSMQDVCRPIYILISSSWCAE